MSFLSPWLLFGAAAVSTVVLLLSRSAGRIKAELGLP